MALSSRAKNALKTGLADEKAAHEIAAAVDAAGAGEATTPSGAIANLTITATTGTLPTANGALTIANATTGATVGELLEAVVELNAKLIAVNAVLASHGLTA